MRIRTIPTTVLAAAAAASVIAALLFLAIANPGPEAERVSVIVQASDMEAAAEAVRAVGGEVSHELGIIRAVAATVSEGQRSALRERGLHLQDDAAVGLAWPWYRSGSTEV